jgi:molecular chaperone DnaK
MISQAEANAETDKERRQVIEASNQADSVCADTEKAITEFGESLSAEEKESVQALIKDLRELSMKAQAGDAAISSETIKNKVGETQQASLKLFQKVPFPRQVSPRLTSSQGLRGPRQGRRCVSGIVLN